MAPLYLQNKVKTPSWGILDCRHLTPSHHSNLISCYIPPCTLGDNPAHWTSHDSFNSIFIYPPPQHLCFGYNAFPWLSALPKSLLFFSDLFKYLPWYLPSTRFENKLFSPYYCFNLILLFIRIYYINICSSFLCGFIFYDIDINFWWHRHKH